MVVTHTSDGVVLSLNPAAAESLGHEAEELAGRNLAEIVPPSHQARLAHYLAQAAADGSGEGLITFFTSRGEERTFMYRQRLVADAEPPYVLLNALDVTERLRAEDVLQHQALHDPLTGCANRLLSRTGWRRPWRRRRVSTTAVRRRSASPSPSSRSTT